MEKSSIMITYKINETGRAILSEVLGADARLFFLDDLPSGLREQRLLEADVLWTLRSLTRQGIA